MRARSTTTHARTAWRLTTRTTTPRRGAQIPLGVEDELFRRYLADLHLARITPTLDAYLATVVTPTLEAQKRAGCLG